jgi:hypothetical protein
MKKIDLLIGILAICLIAVLGANVVGQGSENTVKVKKQIDSTIVDIRMKQTIMNAKLDSLLHKIKKDPEKFKKRMKK